jgi:hypothetical protein
MGGIRWLHLLAALQNTPSLSVLVLVPLAFSTHWNHLEDYLHFEVPIPKAAVTWLCSGGPFCDSLRAQEGRRVD